MELKNVPEYAHHYEFMVCREYDGALWFYGAYSDAWKAEQVCHEIENGIIVHNVRIQGYAESL